MKRFNFNKPLVESPTPPLNTDVLWVNIDESTGEILSIKEFDNEWKEKLNQNKGIPDTHKILYTTSNNSILTYPNAIQLFSKDNKGGIVYDGPILNISNSAFSSKTQLTSVVIPNSVTGIGDWAFDGCSSLESVVIGNSVTTIRYMAFRNCTSLTSITIPNSVKSVDDYAF